MPRSKVMRSHSVLSRSGTEMKLTRLSVESRLEAAPRSCSSGSCPLQGADPGLHLVEDSWSVVVLLTMAPQSLMTPPLQLLEMSRAGRAAQSQVAQSDSNAHQSLLAAIVMTVQVLLAVAVGLHTALASLQRPHSAPASRSMCSYRECQMPRILPQCRSSLTDLRLDRSVFLAVEASL